MKLEMVSTRGDMTGTVKAIARYLRKTTPGSVTVRPAGTDRWFEVEIPTYGETWEETIEAALDDPGYVEVPGGPPECGEALADELPEWVTE